MPCSLSLSLFELFRLHGRFCDGEKQTQQQAISINNTVRITWKQRHLPEINSEALNNYFYIFLNIADCLQLFIYSNHYSLDGFTCWDAYYTRHQGIHASALHWAPCIKDLVFTTMFLSFLLIVSFLCMRIYLQ